MGAQRSATQLSPVTTGATLDPVGSPPSAEPRARQRFTPPVNQMSPLAIAIAYTEVLPVVQVNSVFQLISSELQRPVVVPSDDSRRQPVPSLR